MQAKKPTRAQRKLIEKQNLDPYVWYVSKDTTEKIELKHVETGEVKTFDKTGH